MGYDRRWLDEPHLGDHVGRSVWALGEILSTAWVPALVGPSERLLDAIVGTSRHGLVAADRRLRRARACAARPGPARCRRASCWSVCRAARRRLRGARDRGLALVRGRAHLRQRPAPARADRRRRRARRAPDAQTGLEALRWLGDESGLADGMLRLTGHRGRAPRRARPRAPATSSRSTPPRSSRPSSPRSSSPATPSTACARGRVRLVPRPQPAPRPLYDFATGGCSDGLGDEDANRNEGAESTLAFHRAALLLDAAGLPAVAPPGARRETLMLAIASCSSAIRPPDPDRRRLAVSRELVFNPARHSSATSPSCSPA